MVAWCKQIVGHSYFNWTIIGLIILNGIVVGFETYPEIVEVYGGMFETIHSIVLIAFIIEAIMKMVALSPKPQDYFKDGWNLFDFAVILMSLIPASGQMAMVARLARLLRVMRLISAFPQLRIIVTTLVHSIPGMLNVVMLMSIMFYIYAVAGYHLFHDIDPTHWQTLGLSLLTLFRIVTLEDWTDVMYAAMEANPYYWIYFVSFVVLGTFVIVNLFIAVVINNLEEAKHETLDKLLKAPSKDEILAEILKTQQALERLTHQLDHARDDKKGS